MLPGIDFQLKVHFCIATQPVFMWDAHHFLHMWVMTPGKLDLCDLLKWIQAHQLLVTWENIHTDFVCFCDFCSHVNRLYGTKGQMKSMDCRQQHNNVPDKRQ